MHGRNLLTVHEVAEALKVKETTIRTWIRDRRLRAIKMGKEYRVDADDLESFIQDHTNH
ncbi:MAG: DNA-binding protein [Rhodospirillales bacterium]|nr:MAG: DNA-binding protein [Rhodospirillales bacterium]